MSIVFFDIDEATVNENGDMIVVLTMLDNEDEDEKALRAIMQGEQGAHGEG